MTRARGQSSRTLLNREYPHQILVPSWNVRGKMFKKVDAFHVQIGAPLKKRSIFKNDSWYELYCFAQRHDADSFQELFGGHLTPVKAED
jgi:hypothetical protein